MHYLFISIFLISFTVGAQVSKEFDMIYQKVVQEMIGTDTQKALEIADSLVVISKTNEETISAYMLKAQIQRQKGMGNKAIENALIAEEISYNNNIYDWNARICGFLSTQYRENGIPAQGKQFLNKALVASKNIKDKNQSLKFQGNLQQELAYYEMDAKHPAKAIAFLKKGNDFFKSMNVKHDKNFHLAVNAELIGKNYVLLNQPDSAKIFYNSGLDLLEDSTYESSPLKGFIYNGLGNIYASEQKYDLAYKYYQRALVISENSQFMALQHEIYSSLLNYYKLTNDNKNYILYNEKFLDLLDKENELKVISANQIVKKHSDNQQESKKRQWLIVALALGLLTSGFFTLRYIYQLKRKKDFERFKLILNKVKERSIEASRGKSENFTEVAELKKQEVLSKTKEYLPKETEEKLLGRLHKFENSLRFLEKTISLSVLAGRLGTNTKYLSYVINKHKHKDFSAYINELRIYYIINKMETDPRYLNYKISYLAEECGFSSHSKFTTTFKNITGISPSVFLSYLEEQKNEELINKK